MTVRRASRIASASLALALGSCLGGYTGGCASAPDAGVTVPASRADGAGMASLAPCPPRPNCVSSLEGDVEGFAVERSVAATRARLERAIRATGGTLETSLPGRLQATWRSPLFGFVDDVELALAPDGRRFEVRSAARVGDVDFGVNRRRVRRLHERFAADTGR